MSAPEQTLPQRPRVFISYSHDSSTHCDRVLSLAQQLRRDGIDVELDQFHQGELLHWPRWCAEQLSPENSDFVLCVCTAEYKRRVEGQVPADVGKGVFWEGTIIYNYFYDEKGNRRCVPVLLDKNANDIPSIFGGYTRFELDIFDLANPQSPYSKLYRLLTKQSAIRATAVGELQKLPPLPEEQRRIDFMGLIAEIRGKVADIERVSVETKADTSDILNLLHAMPPASKMPLFKKVEPAEEVRERLPYFFGTRQSTFVGREEDQRTLERFLATPSSLSWVLVIGPGGSGKSRMALELLRKYSAVWEGGFLENLGDVNWASWQPRRDTLLVIDYARTRTKDFRRACSTLYGRASAFKHRVRFLLLDRPEEAKSPNDNRKTAAQQFYGVGTDQAAILSTEFAEHRFLAALDSNDIWKIIKEAVPQQCLRAVNRRQVLKSLKESDPQGRPLFALFAAHAISNGRGVRQWSARALTQWVLEQERERYWTPAGVADLDLNLLALSTLIGGLSIDYLRTIADGTLLPMPDQVSTTIYAKMCGRRVESSFPPLEPDILGELFVLDHFRRDDRLGQPLASRLASLAWQLAPAAMAAFLWRAFGDFDMPRPAALKEGEPDAEDQAVQEQLDRLRRLRLANPPKEWLVYAPTILWELREKNDRQGHATECEKIRSLYEIEPQDHLIRTVYAKALAGEITLSARANDIPVAVGAFKHLRALSDQSPENIDIRDSYVKAVAEMLLRGLADEDFAPRHVLEKIDGLASRFPEDGELKKWYEICDLCLRIAYPAVIADPPHKCALCGRPALQFASEEERHCVLCFLVGSAQSNSYTRHRLFQAVESSIDRMWMWMYGLHSKRSYQKGAWSRETFADALLSVACYSDETDTLPKLPALSGWLYELCEMYPSQRHLLESYAQIVPGVIHNSSKYNLSLAEALHMVDRLEIYFGRLSPKDRQAGMFIWLGVAKFAIISSFAGQCTLGEILAYLDRALKFFNTVPNERKAQFTLYYLFAVSGIIQEYENVDVSKALLERVATLAGLYANVRDISSPWYREHYALALATMIRRYRKSGSPTEAAALSADLESLVTKYPEEEVLRAIREGLSNDETEGFPDDIPAPSN